MRLFVLGLMLVCASASAEEPIRTPYTQDRGELGQAISRFEFGDYEKVVTLLRPLVETGAKPLPTRADRVEALRIYGISCVMTGRSTAAEGAFLLLLREQPTTRLSPTLVRPEAVAFFDKVRERYIDELLRAYRQNRPKRYAILNMFPPAGQFQNRQRGKAYALLGLEIGLLGLNLVSGSLLYAWAGDNQTFEGHEDAARGLIPTNYASFGAFIAVVFYGIVDGFVVGRRLNREDKLMEQKILAGEIRF